MMGIEFIGIILAIWGVISLIAGARQAAQNRAFQNAQTVKGTVTNKHIRAKSTRPYQLVLAYSVDGTAYERQVSVSASEYENVEIGGRYEVLYLPDKPKSILSKQSTDPETLKKSLIIGAMLLGVGVVLFVSSKM